MAQYLGDFNLGQNIDIFWNSYNSLGAPVARTSAGTITVYKGNSATGNLHGVTDSATFNSVVGLHLCRVSSASSAFFTAGADYSVVLSGDSIDGQFFSACLGQFSLSNRQWSNATYAEVTAVPSATGPTAPAMLAWVYATSRYSQAQTATVATLYTSNATAIGTSASTDDGTTFKAGLWA